MPYSDDKKRLEQMLPYLNSLAEGKDVEFRITRGSANTVAFRLREALRLARIYANEYQTLARYAGDYSIKVINSSIVRAVRRTPTLEQSELAERTIEDVTTRRIFEQTIDPVEAELGRSIGSKAAALEVARTESQKELLGAQTPVSIVDSYRRLGNIRPTLHFPEAGLDAAELEELWRWADEQTPRLMLMVAEPAVTVALYDPMAAEYRWRPDATEPD